MGSRTKLQVILELGAEGGSITIMGRKSPGGAWRFCLEKNEAAMADLLSEEDLADFASGDFHSRSAFVSSFDEALRLIDQYPWHRLWPTKVHSEFYDSVLAAVRKRGGDVERWIRMLSQEG
jgi:hypothetical protein